MTTIEKILNLKTVSGCKTNSCKASAPKKSCHGSNGSSSN